MNTLKTVTLIAECPTPELAQVMFRKMLEDCSEELISVDQETLTIKIQMPEDEK